MSAIGDAALSYLARGWQPVVLKAKTKKPIADGWQNLRYDEATARQAFNGAARNVGVAMGPASNGLTDCDLDSPEAIAAGAFFLPQTGAIFGRAGARNSHRLYKTDLADKHPSAEITFTDPIADKDRASLLEIRIGGGGRGAQTVFPPSQHPSGEKIAWEVDGRETEVEGERLIECASRLAAASLCARYWPAPGARHHAAQVTGGFLARCGWTPPQVKLFASAIAAFHLGGEDWSRTAEDSAIAHQAGRNAFGYPELEAQFGAPVAKRIAQWLKFEPGKGGKRAKSPNLSQPSAQLSAPPSMLEYDHCLGNDPDLCDIASYNEFADVLILNRQIPHAGRPPPADFSPRPWRDQDDVALVEAFNQRGFPRITQAAAHSVVDLRARELASFHPVRQYLASLRWDCEERLSHWLIRYCGAVTEGDTPEETERRQTYVEAIGRASLIACVSRIMRPGCKHDSMLVLEGEQGALKSSMLRILAVRDEWFSDSLPHDLADKDARQHLAGLWIVEMSEVAQFRRSEIENLKAYLSCQADRYRPSYGRADVHRPRQCVFFGTTNAHTYLVDETGNRRFWPVRITNIDLDSIRLYRDQLWAEAVSAYESDEKWWLSPNLEAIASAEQSARVEIDPWHDIISKYVGSFTQVTTAQILRRPLEITDGKQNRADEMRVSRVLRLLGWERKKRLRGGVMGWVYERRGEP